MDSINSIFKRNMYIEKPTSYKTQQKTMLSLAGKDIFASDKKQKTDINAYIDILYKQNDDDVLSEINKLKLTGAYTPIKSKTIHYNSFLF